MEAVSTPEGLYSLPPEQFTAARDAAVKQAKASGQADVVKGLGALRRPSVSAWLVNRLARDRTELLEQLLGLGPALAAAQAARSGEDLRALGEQRRQLVEAVVDQAVADADRPVSAAVRAEVASTLEAALADPPSADAVRSGLLVRALSFAGFGGVDLDGAVAAPVQPAPGHRRKVEDVEAAERAALDAAGALDDAVRRCEDLERARTRAQQQLSAAAERVQRLEDELVAAREREAEAGTAVARAGQESADAVKAVQRAQKAAEVARAALDRLRRA